MAANDSFAPGTPPAATQLDAYFYGMHPGGSSITGIVIGVISALCKIIAGKFAAGKIAADS